MRTSDWKPFQKNTLRGFFTLTLDSGVVIHKCYLHVKNAARWVGLPAQRYVKKDGTTAYVNLLEFTNREVADNFSAQALRLIDAEKLL